MVNHNNPSNANEDNQSEITSSRMGSTTDIEEMDENGVIKIQKIFRGKLSRDQKEKKLAEKKIINEKGIAGKQRVFANDKLINILRKI